MNLLYFMAGKPAVSAEDIRRSGLDIEFDRPDRLAQVQTAAGPGGAAGVIFAASGEELGYFPQRQEWANASDLGVVNNLPELWLGYDRTAPPTPAELERPELIDGYWCELEGPAGPNRWLIPVGRVFPEGTKLPSSLSLGPGGKLIRRVVPRLAAASRTAAALWAQVRKAHGLLAAGESVPDLEPAEEFRLAVQILSLNYRIGLATAGLLGLLTTANISRVLFLFVDMPGFVEAQQSKKNSPPNSGPPG